MGAIAEQVEEYMGVGNRSLATRMVIEQNNCTRKPEAQTTSNPGVHCDTRETTVVYSRPSNASRTGNVAFVRPQLRRGVGAAVGARLKVSAPGHVRYHTVPSAQGFQSQNSFWVPLALGKHDTAKLEVTWLGGEKSTFQLKVGDRITVKEPSVEPHGDL